MYLIREMITAEIKHYIGFELYITDLNGHEKSLL